jgi:hypothetical protein
MKAGGTDWSKADIVDCGCGQCRAAAKRRRTIIYAIATIVFGAAWGVYWFLVH